MAINNFKPFATGSNANVTNQADYEALAALLTGFQSGKASSAQINKAIRQGTVMAYVLAQFIANSSGKDVLDNGDTATILTNLLAGLKANSANDFLQKANCLSEILTAGAQAQSSTRINLGLGNSATKDTGTIAGTVAAGDDSRITGAAQKSSNLSDLASISNARSNLGLGSAAVASVGTGANQIPDMNSFSSGTNWLKLPDGSIIQRGISVAGSIGSPTFINFPVAFTNYSTVQVVVSYDNAASTVTSVPSFAATPVNTGFGFNLMGSQAPGSNTTYCRWIAVGK